MSSANATKTNESISTPAAQSERVDTAAAQLDPRYIKFDPLLAFCFLRDRQLLDAYLSYQHFQRHWA